MSNAELIARARKEILPWPQELCVDMCRALEATDKNLQDALDDRAGWKHSGGELIRQKTELLAEIKVLEAENASLKSEIDYLVTGEE